MIACTLKKCFDPDVVKLILEPGASLLATAITYYSRVKNVRWIKDTSMVTIDGSILHINPFLFEREPYYKIYPTGKKRVPKQVICGSTCMEMDRMLQLENEPGLTIGDFVQIDYIGAYSMAFNNCFINTPPYVYLKDGMKTTLVRDKNKQLMFDI